MSTVKTDSDNLKAHCLGYMYWAGYVLTVILYQLNIAHTYP